MKIDMTVSVGHLLTAVSIVASVVMAYYSIKSDIQGLEMRVAVIEQRAIPPALMQQTPRPAEK